MQKADLLLRSNAIFDGSGREPQPGFVAVAGNRILAAGPSDGAEYAGENTEIHELGDRLICPGFVDVHCFFTGYLLTITGADLGGCATEEEVLSAAKAYQNTLKPGATVLARNVRPGFGGLTREKLDQEFGSIPAILFMESQLFRAGIQEIPGHDELPGHHLGEGDGL